MKRILFMLTMQIFVISLSAQKNSYWKKISEPTDPVIKKERTIIPEKYSVYQLDLQALSSISKTAAKDFYFNADKKGIVVLVPMPDGSLQRFYIVETEVMHSSLGKQFPLIKTFAGLGIDDKLATLRMDITPKGFHGMILSSTGIVFIEPYNRHTTSYYISYFKKDNPRSDKEFECEVIDKFKNERAANKNSFAGKTVTGELKSYRLAVAATGEYTNYHGGTVADGISAITTSVSRITGIYEVEVGVRLELVPNNNKIVYTNSLTDPYTNNGGSVLLTQNQTTLDLEIGNNNYDIGHVFTTGGGGVANLGCVCRSTSKAKGTSGRNRPEGDAFDVDYVAHEMGHQFDAEHTFNALSGSCSGNRSGSSAFEPGSGITIMGYAGICGSTNNLAAHSIGFFHNRSFIQINNYVTTGAGGNCPTIIPTGNDAPVITSISNNYSIPVNTPFRLNGTGSDPNGDAFTYSWEQYDNGPAGNWNNPSGDAPIFRSYEPVSTGERLFPILNNVLNNTNTKGELKPSYARTLHFRLTLRDNKGGVANNDDLVAVTVVGTGNPFEITVGNTPVTIPGGTTQSINWNVASTNLAPINCSSVKITASTDGGNSFPFMIATGAPNTGSYTYVVPNANLTNVRIKVEGNSNIFYDINNANLSVSANEALAKTPVNTNMFAQAAAVQVYPNPVKDFVNITIPGSGKKSLTIVDAVGKTYFTKMVIGGYTENVVLPKHMQSGNYFIKIEGFAPVKVIVMQ